MVSPRTELQIVMSSVPRSPATSPASTATEPTATEIAFDSSTTRCCGTAAPPRQSGSKSTTRHAVAELKPALLELKASFAHEHVSAQDQLLEAEQQQTKREEEKQERLDQLAGLKGNLQRQEKEERLLMDRSRRGRVLACPATE